MDTQTHKSTNATDNHIPVDKEWDMVISCICAFVCLCVHALKGKWLELSIPKLVQMLSMTAGSRAATATVSAFADMPYHTDPGLRIRPPTRAVSAAGGNQRAARGCWGSC